MADSSTVGVLTNIFTAPHAAFAAIKERPNPWLPLLVLIIGTFAVQFTYMQVVDLPWLIDQQLQQAGNITEEQRNQAVDGSDANPAERAYGAIAAVSSARSSSSSSTRSSRSTTRACRSRRTTASSTSNGSR